MLLARRGEKGDGVVRGERAMKAAMVVVMACAVVAFMGWGVSRVSAQEEQVVGRYEMAVPDLILDTTTGRLTSRGRVLENAIDPTGTEVGRYTVDAYVTAVTRHVGLNVLNQPVARTDLVKGYVVGDTKTGMIVRQQEYYSQPIQPGDL